MKNLIIAILYVVPVTVLSQNFSGEIVYEDFDCQKDEVYETRLDSDQNTKTSRYLISGTAYKYSKYKNDTFQLSYTYDSETSNLVDEKAGQSYLTYRSSQKSYAKPNKVTVIEDSTIIIQGYKCYPVILEYDDNVSTKYYSRDLRIPYKSFKGHNLGYWFNCLKLTDGGITLRTVTKYENKISVSNAITVTERILSKDDFQIPPNKLLIASGYDLENPPKMNQPTQDQIQCYRSKLLYGQSLVEEELISSISFIVTKNGKLEEVQFFNSYGPSVDNVTMDILKNCGLTFNPGQLDGEYIDSNYYFSVKYTPLVKK